MRTAATAAGKPTFLYLFFACAALVVAAADELPIASAARLCHRWSDLDARMVAGHAILSRKRNAHICLCSRLVELGRGRSGTSLRSRREGLLGYGTGGIAAGIFLVLDKLEGPVAALRGVRAQRPFSMMDFRD